MQWDSNNGKFSLTIPLDLATPCTLPGRDATEPVTELARVREIAKQLDSIKPEDLRDELSGFGAWSELDLANHQENRLRMLWVACCDLVDEAREFADYPGGRGD